jgi:putative cardiolipin synthase
VPPTDPAEVLRAAFDRQTGPDTTPPPVPPLASATDPLGYGPIAEELKFGRLGLVWAFATVYADPPQRLKGMGASHANVPLEDVESVGYSVRDMMRGARREVVLTSPYLVPGERGMALLRELRARGVKVRILTSSLAATDAPVVHIGYAHYREPMLQQGIELYELRPEIGAGNTRFGAFGPSRARLHAKAMAVDGRYLLIGSMNLDPRSIDLNSELGLLINSPALAGEVRRLFDEVVSTSSYRVERSAGGRLRWVTQTHSGPAAVEDSVPESSFWRRLGFWLLAPLAPEEML